MTNPGKNAKAGAVATVKEKPAPGPRTATMIRAASAVAEHMPMRPEVGLGEDGVIRSPHSDPRGFYDALAVGLGGVGEAWINTQVQALSQVTTPPAGDGPDLLALNAALAHVAAVAPRDEAEGALAVQMAATHTLSMHLAIKARHSSSVEAMAAYVGMLTKLQRTSVAQVEALTKLRTAGKQVIEVQHVHVYPGGQAVVGTVNAGGGVRPETARLPQGKHAEGALLPAMLGEDAGGHALPGSCDAREAALSDTWGQEPRCGARASQSLVEARDEVDRDGRAAPADRQGRPGRKGDAG